MVRPSVLELRDFVNKNDIGFKKKEIERNHRNQFVPPKHIVKPDSFYRELYRPKLDKKIRSNMEAVFKKPYDQLNKNELHIFVENIVERLYLLKKYFPKRLTYVIKGVLNHPNLSLLDKNVRYFI